MKNCERPPTKWEVIKAIAFKTIKFLDENKAESLIICTGISAACALFGVYLTNLIK